MHKLQLILAAAIPAAAVLLIILICILFITNCKDSRLHGKPQSGLYAGVKRNLATNSSSRVGSAWRTTVPIKPFSWSEHPSLIAEAVEHGWATFAFAYTCSTCPGHTTLWGICTQCSHVQDNEPEISWEIMGPSSDYMQKIRLNPGLPMRKDNIAAVVQALQTALPLPGPPLGTLSFPQEAYFELNIVAEGHEYSGDLTLNSIGESEYSKLMSRYFLSGKRLNSDHAGEGLDLESGGGDGKAAQSGKEKVARLLFPTAAAEQLQAMAVGFGAGGASPFRFPGFDAGSAGFHSNGSIFVNGAPFVEQDPKFQELRKRAWSSLNSTIGCGFDPSKKRIFFTLNGDLVSELVGPSSEFGYPLYPILAANYDVTVVVNFGQSLFEYAPANMFRIADPCFKRPLPKSGKNGAVCEDSGDLFSMGKIDSQWLADKAVAASTSSSQELHECHQHALSETESELFEIVLEGRG